MSKSLNPAASAARKLASPSKDSESLKFADGNLSCTNKFVQNKTNAFLSDDPSVNHPSETYQDASVSIGSTDISINDASTTSVTLESDTSGKSPKISESNLNNLGNLAKMSSQPSSSSSPSNHHAGFVNGHELSNKSANSAAFNNSNSNSNNNSNNIAHSKASSGTVFNPVQYQECENTNMADSALFVTDGEMRSNNFYAIPIDSLPKEADISLEDLGKLNMAHHDNPFRVLGCHPVTIANSEDSVIVIRVWMKSAKTVSIEFSPGISDCNLPPSMGRVRLDQRCNFLFQKAFKIHQRTPKGEIGAPISNANIYAKYTCFATFEGQEDIEQKIADTYNFGLILPTYDLELFQRGSCWHVDNLMGSHYVSIDGVWGVRFACWAPNCLYVSVVGDFNEWDGRAHPMRKRWEFGVWELFVPNAQKGQKYGYRIHSRSGADFIKIDPYSQEYEIPPKTASVISACDDAFKSESDRFHWTDQVWMEKRKMLGVSGSLRRQPMSIYEVHLPSWMRGDGNTYLSYREIASRLVEHVKAMNFTHVEFLPLAHHPFEGSWGYQVTGQYAPYSRLGSPDDFKYLVNTLHENGVGVFIDFVPAHFCKDAWGLVHYDGEPCYEYSDPREGEHKTWGTMIFNYRRTEVRSFILGAAYHWLRRYHIDGLRIDAVSSMIYRDHLKKDGEWIPNEHGGHANIEAISLLQELNWVIHREFPGVFTMAEESTSWKGVTDQEQGLGFDAKWDLGWMNDTLTYLCCPVEDRRKCHNKLTFRGLYMAHEKWILPLSHDEVVSGKGSLLDKCGYLGTPFEVRIRALKTLYGFQIGMPGRPLIFMGGEIAQGREWKDNRSVDWHEGEEELRKKMCIWLSDLLNVYRENPALHAGDDEVWNFKWTDCENAHDCVLAFIRSYKHWYNDILVICNFNDQAYHGYPIGVPHGGEWNLLLNSDDWKYAGGMTGLGNGSKIQSTQGGRLGWPYCLWVDIPPSGCLIIKAPQPSQEKIEADIAEEKAEQEAVMKELAALKIQQ